MGPFRNESDQYPVPATVYWKLITENQALITVQERETGFEPANISLEG